MQEDYHELHVNFGYIKGPFHQTNKLESYIINGLLCLNYFVLGLLMNRGN